MSRKGSLLPIVRKYFEKDPVTAAHSLEGMSEEEAVGVLIALPPQLSAQAFPHLQVTYAAALLKEVPPDTFKQILERLSPEQGASIFMHLSLDVREQFLEHLSKDLKQQIREFLTYPTGSAGQLMSTSVMSFRSEFTVRETIQRIRQVAKKDKTLSYTYVTDRDNKLVGVINMRDIMLADPNQTLDSVMRKEIFSVNAFMDREQVAQELGKRKYFSAPVVDHDHRLLGVIKAERLIQGIQQEATEDIQKMFGAGGDERAFSPMWFSLKNRLPWLHVNLATAFLAASVVSLFENLIAEIVVLAIFLPVVAGQGGNAGAQSLAIVMRGIVMREIPKDKHTRLMIKEGGLGIINGLVTGVVTGLIAWYWKGIPALGLVIFLAMVVNLCAAGLFGAAIPLVMKSLRLDPAQCSSIILTTVTDVVGFFAFLGFAVLFRSHLI
jgi:magnesium transporter